MKCAPHARPRTSRRTGVPTRVAVCLSCALGALLALSPRSSTGAASDAPLSPRAAADLPFLEGLRGASGRLVAALRAPGQPLLASPPRGLAALYVPNEGNAIV